MLAAFTQWHTGTGACTLSYDPRRNPQTTEFGLTISCNELLWQTQGKQVQPSNATVRLQKQSQRRFCKKGLWFT